MDIMVCKCRSKRLSSLTKCKFKPKIAAHHLASSLLFFSSSHLHQSEQSCALHRSHHSALPCLRCATAVTHRRTARRNARVTLTAAQSAREQQRRPRSNIIISLSSPRPPSPSASLEKTFSISFMMYEDQMNFFPLNGSRCDFFLPSSESFRSSSETAYLSPRSSSPYNSSSNLADQWYPISPRSEKVVNTCKNCSFSFRVSSTKISEFCSKDCETCFTVFYNMNSPTPTKERTLSEIRQSIFHFQQSRMDEDSTTTANTTQVTDLAVVQVEEEVKMHIELQIEEEKSSPKKTPNKKAHKASPKVEPKRGLTSGLMFFTTPRPLRPALHAFF
eukprot:scaffold1490_cov162-Ochromonas_danica.AAC.47